MDVMKAFMAILAEKRFEEIGFAEIARRAAVSLSELRMKHTFYHRDDNNFVDATLLGFVDIEVSTGRIMDWQLITTEATYGRIRFGVAVRRAPARP